MSNHKAMTIRKPKYLITTVVGAVAVIITLYVAILGFQYLSEKNVFRTIGRDSFGYPKSVTSEEMLSLRYVGDLALVLLYWVLYYLAIGRLLAGPINWLSEWEERAFKRKRVKYRKFEDYHHFKHEPDDD